MGWSPFNRRKLIQEDPKKYRGLLIRKHVPEEDGRPRIELLEPSDYYHIPTSYVEKAVQEGWMSYPDGYQVVHRPGGNKTSKWSASHTFVHAPTIAIHTITGEERFKVAQQPDKWGYNEDERDDDGDFVGTPDSHVHWFYLVERL